GWSLAGTVVSDAGAGGGHYARSRRAQLPSVRRQMLWRTVMPRDYTHQDYVACLPEPFRQQLAAAEPETTWWPWRDTTLHIARLRNSAAQARLIDRKSTRLNS